MYYCRARVNMLWAHRNRVNWPMTADLGKLSDAEAQAVVLSTFLFRMYNRMGTFVRFGLLRFHVNNPDKAGVGAWEAALARLTEAELDEIHRADRILTDRVVKAGGRGEKPQMKEIEPGAVLACEGAVRPHQVKGFLNYVDALMRKGIKAFTGEHQVQGQKATRAVIEQLMTTGEKGSTELAKLTNDLRSLMPTKEASVMQRACARLKYDSVGPFLQYQILLDLIEPRHSIFRGCANEDAIKAGRFTYAQFGPGSLGGAGLVKCGDRKTFESGGAKGQAGALTIARALVEYGNNGALGSEWKEAIGGLCPLPKGQTGHFPDGSGLGWDMQAVENVLCGIHNKKTPQQIIHSAMKQGKPWTPNPCTSMEYDELYCGAKRSDLQ